MSKVACWPSIDIYYIYLPIHIKYILYLPNKLLRTSHPWLFDCKIYNPYSFHKGIHKKKPLGFLNPETIKYINVSGIGQPNTIKKNTYNFHRWSGSILHNCNNI